MGGFLLEGGVPDRGSIHRLGREGNVLREGE